MDKIKFKKYAKTIVILTIVSVTLTLLFAIIVGAIVATVDVAAANSGSGSGSGSGSSNNAPEWMVALFATFTTYIFATIPFILALSAIGITSFILFIFGILFVIEAFKDTKNFMAEAILGILGLFVMPLLLLIGAALTLGKLKKLETTPKTEDFTPATETK